MGFLWRCIEEDRGRLEMRGGGKGLAQGSHKKAKGIPMSLDAEEAKVGQFERQQCKCGRTDLIDKLSPLY